MRKTSAERDASKYGGSIYAMTMVIHCPSYTHRIPNACPGLTFGGACILKDILVSLQGGLCSGGLILGIFR